MVCNAHLSSGCWCWGPWWSWKVTCRLWLLHLCVLWSYLPLCEALRSSRWLRSLDGWLLGGRQWTIFTGNQAFAAFSWGIVIGIILGLVKNCLLWNILSLHYWWSHLSSLCPFLTRFTALWIHERIALLLALETVWDIFNHLLFFAFLAAFLSGGRGLVSITASNICFIFVWSHSMICCTFKVSDLVLFPFTCLNATAELGSYV